MNEEDLKRVEEVLRRDLENHRGEGRGFQTMVNDIMAELRKPEHVWPGKLMLRCTGIVNEQEGSQIIYTTTGRGYEKHPYYEGEAVEVLQNSVSKVAGSPRTSEQTSRDLWDALADFDARVEK